MKRKEEIVYNKEKESYTKIVIPKISKRLKYYLGLRRYPGHNVKYMVDLLNNNGINTFEILSYSKYMTETKEIKGKTLFEVLQKEKDLVIIEKLLDKYSEVVAKIIDLGIYFGDFNYFNFILKDEEIYVIDLEDYRKDFLCRFRKREMLRRLKEKLYYMKELLGRTENVFDGEKIYLKILKKLSTR